MSTFAKTISRRPIRMRDAAWAKSTAIFLKQSGLKPNQISCFSVVFAAVASAILFFLDSVSVDLRPPLLILVAVFIFLRLLCNLFDGMVAVEGGLSTKSGEIFNDFPDRASDTLILVGLGYSLRPMAHAVDLGWLAACLAVMSAYVRYLGGATGAGQYFLGPMAKQHRMSIIMGGACLSSVLEPSIFPTGTLLVTALVLIVLGELVTIYRRLSKIVRVLETP